MTYTAIVLTLDSQNQLKSHFNIPETWEIICHHMTCNMGLPNDSIKHWLGQKVNLIVRTLAKDDLVMAVGVDTDVPSTNNIKHITLAVNRKNGGKPYLSNNLIKWEPVSELFLQGIVQTVN